MAGWSKLCWLGRLSRARSRVPVLFCRGSGAGFLTCAFGAREAGWEDRWPGPRTAGGPAGLPACCLVLSGSSSLWFRFALVPVRSGFWFVPVCSGFLVRVPLVVFWICYFLDRFLNI